MNAPLDVHAIRVQLQARAATLRSELPASLAASLTEHEVGDFKDEADALAQHAVADAGVERDWRELHGIRTALARLDQGVYGVCVDCDESIAPARLSAQPAAIRCLACQAAAESPGGRP